MTHLYFFKSTNSKDKVGCITILTSSAKKAFALAYKTFAKHGYVGQPCLLAI